MHHTPCDTMLKCVDVNSLSALIVVERHSYPTHSHTPNTIGNIVSAARKNRSSGDAEKWALFCPFYRLFVSTPSRASTQFTQKLAFAKKPTFARRPLPVSFAPRAAISFLCSFAIAFGHKCRAIGMLEPAPARMEREISQKGLLCNWGKKMRHQK